MLAIEKAKEEVVKIARAIYQEKLVFGTWGNVSCRPVEDRIIITPSGIPYLDLQFVDMVVVDAKGNVLEGRWKPSTELPMHLAIYQARSDAGAIVHTHSPYSTAFAVARQEIPVVIEEQAQIIGGIVKVADYALAGSQELADNAVQILGKEQTAVLLANHGLVCIGDDLETALQRCKIVERTAQILLQSKLIGEAVELHPDEVKALKRHYLTNYGQQNESGK